MTDRTYEEGWADAIEAAVRHFQKDGREYSANYIRALRPPAPPEPLLRCECGGAGSLHSAGDKKEVNWAVCGTCGAETPAYPTEALARAAWNRMQRRDG